MAALGADVIHVESVTHPDGMRLTGMMFGASTNGERSWTHADVVLDKPIRYEQLSREIARLIKLNN